MRNEYQLPNACDYLQTNRQAVELWLDGKYLESVNSFSKDCRTHGRKIKGEDVKADYFALARQVEVGRSRQAIEHQQLTDNLCYIYRTLPNNCLEAQKLLNQIGERREGWRELFGVYTKEYRKKIVAIRLKKFVRCMRLLEIGCQQVREG